MDALDEHGDALRVKVYGRDARDAQLLARLMSPQVPGDD